MKAFQRKVRTQRESVNFIESFRMESRLEGSRRGPMGLLAAANSDLFYRFEAEEAKTQALRVREQQQTEKIAALSAQLVEMTNRYRIAEAQTNGRLREVKESLDLLDKEDIELDAAIKLRSKQVQSASLSIGDMKVQLAHNFTLLSSDMMHKLQLGSRPSTAPAPDSARSSSRRRASMLQASRPTVKQSSAQRPTSASSLFAGRFDPPADLNDDELSDLFPVLAHIDRFGMKHELPFFTSHSSSSSKKNSHATSLKASYWLLESARRDVVEQMQDCETRYQQGGFLVDREHAELLATLQGRLEMIDHSIAQLIQSYGSSSNHHHSPSKGQGSSADRSSGTGARSSRRRSTATTSTLPTGNDTASPTSPVAPSAIPVDVAIVRALTGAQRNVDCGYEKSCAAAKRTLQELRYQLQMAAQPEDHDYRKQEFAASRCEHRNETEAPLQSAKIHSAVTTPPTPFPSPAPPPHTIGIQKEVPSPAELKPSRPLQQSDVILRPKAPASRFDRYVAAADRQYLQSGFRPIRTNDDVGPTITDPNAITQQQEPHTQQRYAFRTHLSLSKAIKSREGAPRRPNRSLHDHDSHMDSFTQRSKES